MLLIKQHVGEVKRLKQVGEVKRLKLKFLLLQTSKCRMDAVLRRARLMAKTKMSGGNKTPLKAQVMVMVREESLQPYCPQVMKAFPEQAKKQAKKIVKGAQESAWIAWIKARKKESKMTLSAREAKLPEPPAGTSTARR